MNRHHAAVASTGQRVPRRDIHWGLLGDLRAILPSRADDEIGHCIELHLGERRSGGVISETDRICDLKKECMTAFLGISYVVGSFHE